MKTGILPRLLLVVLPVLIGLLTALGDDCLSYNPRNLSIVTIRRNGEVSYTVADGPHYIKNFPSFREATAGMRYMRSFNTICFKGRGTPFIREWLENR